MHRDIVPVDGIAQAGRYKALAALFVLGLASCAADPSRGPSRSADEEAPYIGVFTGEFVGGRPLFRFPPIYIVGSRSSAGDD